MLVAKMLIVFAKQTELFAHPVAMCELVLVAFAAVESFSLRQVRSLCRKGGCLYLIDSKSQRPDADVANGGIRLA